MPKPSVLLQCQAKASGGHTTTAAAQTPAHPSPWPRKGQNLLRLLVWRGLAASRLLRCWGRHSVPCLGLTRRAGPAGPSPGERTRRAVRGALPELAWGWGQPRKRGPCVPTHTLHPSAGHGTGVTRVPIPHGLPGPTHLQVRPGLAQHVVGPGHCEREREREKWGQRGHRCRASRGAWGRGQLGRATYAG